VFDTLAVVQARTASKRLPGKVLKMVGAQPLIEVLLGRLSESKRIDKIVVATTERPDDDRLAKTVEGLGYSIFRGSEDDVLDRFYHAALFFGSKTIVRITGDCPLIDPNLVDGVIELYQETGVDYASNVNPPTYPDGLDTEVFSFSALEKAFANAITPYEREHVTHFFTQDRQLNKANLAAEVDHSLERWTIDYPEDLVVIENILRHFETDRNFGWKDVLDLHESHPEYFSANQNLERNSEAQTKTGQQLYERAKKIIPGGGMLLSKRPEQFLPGRWPSYFSRAKGCQVWDLDGNEYIDMSIMGIGTNTLGYGQPEVDNAVRQVIDRGNMSTLNCPEEVHLIERLIELHPWADMGRLCRTGGEANSMAVRIARASSGKDTVLICGYHGWHDWYLAANIESNSELDDHLLPGLAANGVPKGLKGTIQPFAYNDLESLEEKIGQNDIAAIKMEVSRSEPPQQDYLSAVRKLATDNNIILIFDECTSGFRETFGGLHKKYGVDPDMMILGKTLGNGYAITAVLGEAQVMKSAEETFMSSTFWTERIGPSAALKTLEVMERERSWERITEIGKSINAGWASLAKKHALPLKIYGLPALTSFHISSNNWLKYRTFITQEMLKRGFLAADSVYCCTSHSEAIVSEYLELLDPIFGVISECEQGRSIDGELEGPVCHSGFKRLN